jgi:hypothetical protein
LPEKNLPGWRIKEKQAIKTGEETAPFFRICVSEQYELLMSSICLILFVMCERPITVALHKGHEELLIGHGRSQQSMQEI